MELVLCIHKKTNQTVLKVALASVQNPPSLLCTILLNPTFSSGCGMTVKIFPHIDRHWLPIFALGGRCGRWVGTGTLGTDTLVRLLRLLNAGIRSGKYETAEVEN